MRKFEGFQKGVNLGGWISQFDAYSKEHFDTFITRDDIKDIASLGFDHVRVPVDYVLFEEEDKELAGYITGRTEFNTTVHVKGSTDLIGKIANVKMTEHRGFYYIGELTED